MNTVLNSKISPEETIKINVDEINRLILRKAVKKIQTQFTYKNHKI